MQLPVAAAPGVLLIVRKKCNLLLGNVKTYSFTFVLITGEFVVILLLFYSAEKYFQSVQAVPFLFRRIAILSLPKEKASWQLKALFGFCWITIHPLLPRLSGRPTGLVAVLNIIALGGLSISFIPIAAIWEPLLFYSVKKFYTYKLLHFHHHFEW